MLANAARGTGSVTQNRNDAAWRGASAVPAGTAESITVVTPVYLDRPERWDYLVATMRSFYRCCRYPGPLVHRLVDDRSPQFTSELRGLCAAFGIEIVGRVESDGRRGFFDAYRRLLASVATQYFLYLEPDHYFYLPADFLSPMLRLFTLEPELVGVYLRAPMTTQRFRLEALDGGEVLMTFDRARLRRVVIDPENTGWVGRGYQHEGFSLMPTLWRTEPLHAYFLKDSRWIDAANPYELELAVDSDWNRTRLTGYLNAQAFCYHIGAVGGMGGGHTGPGDLQYEQVWSSKIL